jgi:hypothetical protein
MPQGHTGRNWVMGLNSIIWVKMKWNASSTAIFSDCLPNPGFSGKFSLIDFQD